MVILGIIVVALLVIVLGLGWFFGVKSQTPVRLENKITPEGVDYENISFTSGSAKVNGWFIPGRATEERPKPPAIILVHGWGANRGRMVRYTQPLIEQGYAVLMFDMRSHGDSDAVSASTALTCRDDLIAAHNYLLTRHDVDDDRIGILSHSFGALASVLALEVKLPIRVLISDSMPVSVHNMTKAQMRKLKMPIFPFLEIILFVWRVRGNLTLQQQREALNVINALNRSQVPVMIVHSKADDFVLVSEMDHILANLKREVETLKVNSQGHRASETDPNFWPNVLPFLNRHLLQ